MSLSLLSIMEFCSAGGQNVGVFVEWHDQHLAEILCGQEDRMVGKDNVVRYQELRLQSPPDQHRFYYTCCRTAHPAIES